MVLPSPGTPPAQLKHRQWGDSISCFKERRKINHSGWAFVPICHGAAITILFSTLFVFKLKCLDVTGNLTTSAGCLCGSITISLQIQNDSTDMLSFRKMEMWDPLAQILATCHLRNKHEHAVYILQYWAGDKLFDISNCTIKGMQWQNNTISASFERKCD